MCVCVCVCVCENISGTIRAIFTNFMCVLPMSVARSSSGMLTIGRIAFRREGVDGSAQRGRSAMIALRPRCALKISASRNKAIVDCTAIYDCLVST